ncbi:MAG: T9SS type A sorting domain-containing protein [Sphingobacteriales bacterium]|nr:MAG: T9SS type A sorting domain-containing protein [Sphingobacteriales bacterium]
MKKLFSLLSFLIVTTAFGQVPAIQWQKSLGGTGADQAYSIQQTTDGGYIVAGISESTSGDVTGNHGLVDYWIVKLGSTGSIQWQKSLGGIREDYANSVQQTTDGGYIVAGNSRSNDGDVSGNHGGYDSWIVKLASTGIVQWKKTLGGTRNDLTASIQQTADSGYIVAGSSNSNDGDVTGNQGSNDYWVVKLDHAGTIQWQKSLGGPQDDQAASVQQTSDGGYIVAGQSSSISGDVTGNHGLVDYWVVKLTSTGIIQWQKTMGGTAGEAAATIQQTTDGGYVVTGYAQSNNGDVSGNHGFVDYWVVKLTSLGAIQWQKCLGGPGSNYAKSIQQTADGGYIVAGQTNSINGDITGNHGGYDYWLVKLDNMGAIQWQKAMGGTSYDVATSIQQTSDGGYVVAGQTTSNDGDITGNRGSYDYWVVKLEGNPVAVSNVDLAKGVLIYPNPATDQVYIQCDKAIGKVQITDLSGKEIYQTSVSGGSITISTETLANGLYMLHLNTVDGRTVNQKLVVQH